MRNVDDQEIANVVTLIEIIIAWGITPSLSDGLRVPLDLRLKNVSLFFPLLLCCHVCFL